MPLIPAPSGIGFYEHHQTTAATTWTITHGLNYYPVVEVLAYDGGNLVKVFPLQVKHNTLNEVEITFSTPRTGYATFAAPLAT